MITIRKEPDLFSFTKNAMLYEVHSSQFFSSGQQLPYIEFTFYNAWDLIPNYFQFEFINPETAETEIIKLTGVNVPVKEGDVPNYNYFTTVGYVLNQYVDDFIMFLRSYRILTAYYDIIKTENHKFIIRPKQAIDDLLPANIETNVNQISSCKMELLGLINLPEPRLGYNMKALLYFEPNPSSTVLPDLPSDFDFVAIRDLSLDENGIGVFDASLLLNSVIENEMGSVEPVLPESHQKQMDVRRYYVEFKEYWGDSEVNVSRSSIRYGKWGGISYDDEVLGNNTVLINSRPKFFTWTPSGKLIIPNQADWLHWINTGGKKTVSLLLYINNDAAIEVATSIEVDIFETIALNASLSYAKTAAGLTDGDHVAKYGWQITASSYETDVYWFSPIYQNCNAKIICYYNAFGYPETIYTSDEWTENMNNSREIAQRSAAYNGSKIKSKQFAFNLETQNSIKGTTGLLKRSVAYQLQGMLNTSICFIREAGRWWPVIMNASQPEVYMNSEFTMKVDFELLKANPTDRISHYELMPTVSYTGWVGFNIQLQLELNGIAADSISGFIVKDINGTTVDTWVCTDNVISSAFDEESWIEFTEGIYIGRMEVTASVTGHVHIIDFPFEVKCSRVQYWTRGTDIQAIQVESLTSATSYAIGYNGDEMISGFDTIVITGSTDIGNIDYDEDYFRHVTLVSPTFSYLKRLTALNTGVRYINIDAFSSLQVLSLTNAQLKGSLYLNALTGLVTVVISQEPDLSHIEIGFLPALTAFTINDVGIDSDNLELLVREFWTFRKKYSNPITLTLTSLAAFNEETEAMLFGNGIYEGDGLSDNNFTIMS